MKMIYPNIESLMMITKISVDEIQTNIVLGDLSR